MKSVYYIIPLVNFLVAAILGLFLRSLFVLPIQGVSFLYVLHGHSHVALLGWLYMVIYVLFVKKFSVKNSNESQFYRRLFWCTQFAVGGMAITFPFIGYAIASIFFSTLHIICSYIFAVHLWRNNTIKGTQQGLLLKTALFFMMFSTLGVWCLGPAVGMFGKANTFYQCCIQFFLHFQFDGWFLTAFLALLFSVFLQKVKLRTFYCFYSAWISSVVLTFSLPLSWYVELPFLHYLNSFGVLLQLFSIGCLIKPVLEAFKPENYKRYKSVSNLIVLSILCFIMRLLLQLVLLSNVLAIELKVIRSWIVGFIHLNMLGILSGFGIWLFIQEKKVQSDYWIKLGIIFLLLGFFSTEVILLLQGLQSLIGISIVSDAPFLLFCFSVFLPLSILSLLLSYFKENIK